MSRIVIAFGGNALGNNPKEQQNLIKKAVKNIVPLVKDGHEIIIGHGNGPQVGVINLAFEDSYENKDIPYMPFRRSLAHGQYDRGQSASLSCMECFGYRNGYTGIQIDRYL